MDVVTPTREPLRCPLLVLFSSGIRRMLLRPLAGVTEMTSTRTTRGASTRFSADAFISHSSANASLAARVEKRLERASLAAWLDRSEIHVGALLRDELHDAIRQSRTFILLWSKAASGSRWVAAELITSVLLRRFVIACALDETPLPQFLRGTIWIDLRRSQTAQLETLCRAVENAPARPSALPPAMSAQSPELQKELNQVISRQAREMAALNDWKIAAARKLHSQVDTAVRRMEKRWRFDVQVQKVAAYHRKNAYMIKHWDAINGGQAPNDPLLLRAEQLFFKTLFLNPLDYEALNGLANIVFFEDEQRAAAFFNDNAIRLAQRAGVDYVEAKQDRELIRRSARGS